MRFLIAALAVTFLVLSVIVSDSNFSAGGVFEQDVKIGVYYYIWWGLPSPPYRNHWNESVKGTPFLGEYNSSDPEIADKHIILAKQHKISFFAVSWLGTSEWYDHRYIDEQNLKGGFLKASHLSQFNFCLYYESKIILDSVYDMYVNYHYSDPKYSTPADFFKGVFINDTMYAAENYFNHPSYLHVDGKPVFFIHNLPNLYQNLSDTVVKGLFDDARSQLRQKHGEEAYFVGDLGSEPDVKKESEKVLNWTYSMNATTSYLFSPSNVSDSVLNDAETYYPEWLSFMNKRGMQFIPNAYPGFNNTNCEGVIDPVELSPNETMFREMLKTAIKYADNNLKIVMVTSWNEWKEATAIEPSMEFGELFLHTIYDVVPEFPTLLILPTFIIVTLITIGIKTKYFRRCSSNKHEDIYGEEVYHKAQSGLA